VFEDDKMFAVVSLEDTTPIGFLNVYEKGDLWIKIQGCEKCSLKRKKLCCNGCAMLTPDFDCSWQVEEGRSSKPFMCVIWPTPNQCKVDCVIVYKCIRGKHKGSFRHLTDRGGVFR
jgi:hypothetical protein